MLPEKKKNVLRWIRKLQPEARGRSKEARKLTEAILFYWQKISYSELTKGKSVPAPRFANNKAIPRFVDWIVEMDFLDAAFWLSSAYAIWIGDESRRSQAMYFTPPELSARIIENLKAHGASMTKHKWMDPACGGAAFLAPVAIQMALALKKQGKSSSATLKHIATHLVGNDVNPFLKKLSNEFLKMALYEDVMATEKVPRFCLHQVDALVGLERYVGKVDVVICNPPYRKITNEERAGLRLQYADLVGGQPNLYGLFFRLSTKLLKPEGVAGLLTPTSFFSGVNFAAVRNHITSQTKVLQLDLFHERSRLFVGAQLDAAITICERRNKPVTRRSATSVYSLSKAGNFNEVGDLHLPQGNAIWPIPRWKDDMRILKMVNGTSYKFSDYGYTPRVGAFVWNRDRRHRFKSKKQALTARAPYPLIWSSDVSQSGQFQFGRSRYVDDHHIYVNMQKVNHRSVIRRPSVVLQRVTSADQRRRLVGAPLDGRLIEQFGGVVGENHVLFLEQNNLSAKVTPAQLAKVLRSTTMDRLFRCFSGAVNVSVSELESLPLPNPDILVRYLRDGVSVDMAIKKAFKEH
ncbi:MAG TPA: N-6 DNA methylase [Gammaproteobacteria bacterium]|nr:N-6 DNA methylase [Gammaproteobacteria bacterium]